MNEQEKHCELCSAKGLYVFPNGEDMCRAYYQFIEIELREQIAKEIEQAHNPTMYESGNDCWDFEYSEFICSHIKDAAIARGKNE